MGHPIFGDALSELVAKLETLRLETAALRIALASPIPVSIAGDGISVNVDGLSALDITDRAERILGRAGVDVLTVPPGAATEATLATLATDAGLASVFARLGEIRDRLPALLDAGAIKVAIESGLVFDGVTDAQLRASPVPVSLPSGLATASGQTAILDELEAILTRLEATLTVTGNVSVSGSVSVSNLPATQAVSLLSVPLPTGAATSAKQDTCIASLSSIDGKIVACNTGAVTVSTCALPTGAATAVKQDTGNASIASLDGKVTACNTGACVISSSALPTGASTSALQTTCNASLTSIDGKIVACNTGACVISSSALPTGASTSAKQDTGNTSLSSIDGKITACNTGAVTVAASALPAGAATSARQDVCNTSLTSIDGKITACNTGACVVSSSVLPTGAATSALQGTGNTSLASIDGKLPALVAKGTQGANAVTTQDMKDSGRQSWSFGCTGTAGVVNETILSCIATTDLVAGGAANTYTVPAGKRLRIQSLSTVWRNPTAVAGGVTVRLRAAPSGNATATSPLLATVHASSALATIGAGAGGDVSLPDGLELPAGASLCLTQAAITTAAGVEARLVGYLY